MSHDDRGAKDATKKYQQIVVPDHALKPETSGTSFLRKGSFPIVVVVGGVVGCTFGISSGSLHFEGSDPVGPFSGDVSAWDCQGRLDQGGLTNLFFGGTRKGDVIMLIDGGRSIHISTRGGGWSLDRPVCSTFDVRKWFDAEKHLHVVVLVDCTSAEGVRVQGSVRSDACYIMRPR